MFDQGKRNQENRQNKRVWCWFLGFLWFFGWNVGVGVVGGLRLRICDIDDKLRSYLIKRGGLGDF